MIHDSQPAIWPNWLRSFMNLSGGGELEGKREERKVRPKKIIRKNPHNSCCAAGDGTDPLWHSSVVPSLSCSSCLLAGPHLSHARTALGFPATSYAAPCPGDCTIITGLVPLEHWMGDPPSPLAVQGLCPPLHPPEVFGPKRATVPLSCVLPKSQ